MAKIARRFTIKSDEIEQMLSPSTIVTLSVSLLRKAGARKYDAALRTLTRCYGERVPTVEMFVVRYTGSAGVYICGFRQGTVTQMIEVPSNCFIKVVPPQELQRVVPKGRHIPAQRFSAGVSRRHERPQKEEGGSLRL